MVRRIVFIKLLNLYVIGERRLNPELNSKPLAVVKKGRLVDCSPVVESPLGSELSPDHFRRIFPDAFLLPYEEDHYRELFEEAWGLISSYSPVVEPVFLDRGFVDFTGCRREMPLQGLVKELESQIWNRTRMRSSIGSGSNKFIAQLASEKGLFLTPGEEREFVRTTPVRALSQLKALDIEQLERLGVSTLGDLALLPISLLAGIFKERARLLHQLSLGGDPSPVFPLYPPRFFKEEAQFEETEDETSIGNWLFLLSNRLSHRLQDRGEEAFHIVLSISSIKRDREKEHHLLHPISSRGEILRAAKSIVKELWKGEPLTSIVIALSNVRPKENAQLDLWRQLSNGKERRDTIEKTMELIKERYGSSSLVKGFDLPKIKKERMAQLIFREQGRFLF